MNDTRIKWDKIYRERNDAPPRPCRVLEENTHLLPERGLSLELACGLGGNALYLAGHGFDSHAWDISAVAVARLSDLAAQCHVTLSCEARDVVLNPPQENGFDVIVVSHFLDRGMMPLIVAALRPGGLIFYQTFTRCRVNSSGMGSSGPSNDDFRLADNELFSLFAGFRILVYREEGRQGDLTKGFRDEAMIVAQKPERPLS